MARILLWLLPVCFTETKVIHIRLTLTKNELCFTEAKVIHIKAYSDKVRAILERKYSKVMYIFSRDAVLCTIVLFSEGCLKDLEGCYNTLYILLSIKNKIIRRHYLNLRKIF